MSLITKSTYLRGPKGEAGPQGSRGERGPAGPQGPQGIAGTVPNSDAVVEGINNLYFSSARSRASIGVSGDLSYDSFTGIISYVAPATVASIGNHSTSDLVEGTNLYFTEQRVIDIIADSNVNGGEY